MKNRKLKGGAGGYRPRAEICGVDGIVAYQP